jgi:hypothetical protein
VFWQAFGQVDAEEIDAMQVLTRDLVISRGPFWSKIRAVTYSSSYQLLILVESQLAFGGRKKHAVAMASMAAAAVAYVAKLLSGKTLPKQFRAS